jgi:hypothetical protein
MALPVSNSFEGGTNGTTITSANSGGTSGQAFDAIGSGTGTTVAFSSTSMHGSLGAVLAVGSTAAGANLQWSSTSLGTISATSWGRIYFSLSSLTLTGDAILAFYSGSTFGGGIQVGGASAGKLNFQNTAFGQTNTFTTTLTASTWYRLEWQVTPGASAAGNLVAVLYAGDATTALETQTSTTGVYGSSTTWNGIRFGWGAAGANHASQPNLFLDDIQLNSTGYPGPYVASSSPAAPQLIAMPGRAWHARWTPKGSRPVTMPGASVQPVLPVLASDSETSSSAEGQSVTAGLSSADSSASADAGESVVAHVSSADTSTSSDGQLPGNAHVTDSDAGHGTDNQAVPNASVSSSDTGTGTDSAGSVLSITLVTSSDAGTAADAGEHVSASASSSDISSATDSPGAVSARLSDAETGHGTDAGETVTVRITDSDAGHSSDGQGVPPAAVTSSDTGHGTDAGETIAAHVSDNDAAHGADGNEEYGSHVLDSDASGTAADAGEKIRVLAAETGQGTDAGEKIKVLGGADSGHGTDAGEKLRVSDSDSSHATDGGEKLKIADSDAGFAADSGFVSGQATTIYDSDTGHGEDSGYTYIHDSDTGHGTDATGPYGPIGADAGHGTDTELTRWVSDSDSGKATEHEQRTGTVIDSDAGTGSDGGEVITVIDRDYGIMTDTYNPVIDVYTYEASWMEFVPSRGFFRLVYTHPVTGEQREVLTVPEVTGHVLKLARTLATSSEVQFVADSDAGHGTEDSTGLLGVSVSVSRALHVTVSAERARLQILAEILSFFSGAGPVLAPAALARSWRSQLGELSAGRLRCIHIGSTVVLTRPQWR